MPPMFCPRAGFGEAWGELILLAIVTNLPVIAITVSGAGRHDASIAIGNILGGIALQTLVPVSLDAFGRGKSASLTYREASV
jgi:cation:H+ antiporter